MDLMTRYWVGRIEGGFCSDFKFNVERRKFKMGINLGTKTPHPNKNPVTKGSGGG